MLRKIIWATDGSASADRGLWYAEALAQGGASVVVVHAVETFAGSHAEGLQLYVDENEIQARIERQVAKLRADGVDAELRVVVTGLGVRAAHEIAEVAKEVDADVIVTGTRGHTTLGGLLVGSVTQRLLHLAPCAVLTVPADARHSED